LSLAAASDRYRPDRAMPSSSHCRRIDTRPLSRSTSRRRPGRSSSGPLG
jgi:hypothetical protein